MDEKTLRENEIDILYDALFSMKIYDIRLSRTEDGRIFAKDADNQWTGKRFYDFLLNEAIVCEPDGSSTVIAPDTLMEVRQLGKLYGVSFPYMELAENPLRTAEMSMEQNGNMIDGILNNMDTTDEAAFSIDGGSRYLAIQTCESGYDYTFFNQDFEELDGGQLDNPEFSMSRAIAELLSDEGLLSAKLEAFDYELLMERSEAAEKEKRVAVQAAAYAQEVLYDAGLEETDTITGAKVYVSPDADPAHPDYDVLLEYAGDIREDAFFNLLHEQAFSIDGKPVDFNPVTPDKSGTIGEYLETLSMQGKAPEPERPLLRVVPVNRFERYIEPGELTQDQYIVKGGILLTPCASNPDFYESTNRNVSGKYIDAHIYEVAERNKKGKPTAFRVAEAAPVENPFEPAGKEIAITQSGGIPCGLVYKHEMEGFVLANQTVLLQKERDAHGNYYGGVSLDGMMFKTAKLYAAVTDGTGRITAFRQMREKDFSRTQPPKAPEKKPSIREQLARKPEPAGKKPQAKTKKKDLDR